ncbi:PHD finger family protein/bromo-adjacent-like proteiny (BAH) domain-containing protein [Abeliophyllum distichum]|uniref:PHD finger family protein/bromo-adjacent-like proteiny (BAH) domain-containing protein n=1 Tax=Abeliophyllum distichum TaxID=126358 RepID=A0ABD1TXW8_9LAMI
MSMAKARAARHTLESYNIKVKHINKTVRLGECVLMRPTDPSKPSYVARLEKIELDSREANVRVHVRWYYRSEESIGGRCQFHDSKEAFFSDHFDIQSGDTIDGKCTFYNFKTYTKLDAIGNDDFFCCFEYNSSTGAFNPDRVPVYELRLYDLL